jgi:hypothetical protein
MSRKIYVIAGILWASFACVTIGAQTAVELAGMTVIPHVQSNELRYRRDPDPELGARIQLFIRNNSSRTIKFSPQRPILFDGKRPLALLQEGAWSWHDSPSAWAAQAYELPAGAMTVWSFNGKGQQWGVDTKHTLEVSPAESGIQRREIKFRIAKPSVWISAVTFLGAEDSVYPDSVVLHLRNESEAFLKINTGRLWLPEESGDWRVLSAQPYWEQLQGFPQDRLIPPQDSGGIQAHIGKLPLTYAVVQINVTLGNRESFALWSHLRVKREVFDISGGWVSAGINGRSSLSFEPYLKTLKRMHINTGHIGEVSGYTDNEELYRQYPLKYFNRLEPIERYDNPAMLERIHAVEFLGEPQYGGGRPVPPMEVWRKLAKYQKTRLPTTVTHSEERIWRYYAGLSDYPHFDAYRVTAPAADAWWKYERWDGARIRWGAPLETIGALTRSLRDLNRPLPIAAWSQGAHRWGRYGGRTRNSPTPNELRAQAYHSLACRITSLYWFNLSLKSLVTFRDLIDPITEVNRVVKTLSALLLEGAAYEHRRIRKQAKADWDLYSITGPRAAILFALDLDYKADLEERVFQFKEAREGTWRFALPKYLDDPREVFKVDTTGISDVSFRYADNGITITDVVTVKGIYVATNDPELRSALQHEHRQLLEHERALDFNPASDDEDFELLQNILAKKSD